MPTGTLPYIGCYGSSGTDKYDEKIHEFGNNEYRGYARGAVMQTMVNLVFKGIRRDKMTALRTFWRDHKAAGTKAAKEFYFYDPLVADQSDIDGSTSTGKYIAIFLSNEATFVRDSRCRYSCSFNIKILSAA